MNAQVVETKDRRTNDTVPDAPRHERRIVYLKDHPDAFQSDDVMCPVVTCPGHCACASK